MTPPPTPSTGGSLGRVTASPRALAVWTMLAVAGLFLIFAFLTWIFPAGTGSFAGRSAGASRDFVQVFTIALPVLAVLLAVHVQPVLFQAKLVAFVALIEYAVALFFGVITWLIGLGAAFDIDYNSTSAVYSFGRALRALEYLMVGLGLLGLTAVAALITYQAYSALGGRLPTGSRTAP